MQGYLKNNDISIIIEKDVNSIVRDMQGTHIYVRKKMITGDIKTYLKKLYDLNISNNTISHITNKLCLLTMQEVYNLDKSSRKYHSSKSGSFHLSM